MQRKAISEMNAFLNLGKNPGLIKVEHQLEDVETASDSSLHSSALDTNLHSSTNSEDGNSRIALIALLKAWNLEHLKDLFISEKITIHILKIIKPHHIPDLFKNQKMGDLILFEHNLNEWRKNFCVVNKGERTHQSEIPKVLPVKPNLFSPLSISRGPSPQEPSDGLITLSDILKENRKASILIDFYNKHSKFQDEHRHILINIICNYFEDHQYHMSLPTSYRLEKEILDRFPGERAEYYRSGKRGRLYVKYCNAKDALKRLRLSSCEIPNIVPKKPNSQIFSPEIDAEEHVNNLKFNNLSTAEFDSCWQACSQYRLNEIISNSSSLEDIFKKWPEYKTPSGFRLIDNDFVSAFGSRTGVLAGWLKNFSKMKQFLLQENRIKDKINRAMLTDIPEADFDTDSAAVKLMWCIHAYLVPTNKLVRKDNNGKKSVLKFTIRSSQEAFLFVGSNIQEVEDHINFLKTKSEIIQPFILAVGDKDFKSFTNFYVYLDGVKFTFTNFLTALDICFKSYHVFNVDYPMACNQFWALIENHFYQLNKKHRSTKLCIMLESLKNL